MSEEKAKRQNREDMKVRATGEEQVNTNSRRSSGKPKGSRDARDTRTQ